MKSLLGILLTLVVCCATAACSDDILTDVAAQPSYVLNDTSRADTYHLGVLLTGHTTATQKLMLYNQQAGEIVLQSIRLRGGDSSIFRINVDGMAGVDFSQPDYLHIARGDSLCILLEASFDGRQEERDVEREDWLDVACNGAVQSIRLAVTTRDVEELRSDTIKADTLWQQGGIDKLIYGALTIAEGTTLTIGPGVTLYLHDHASVEVYGTLRIEGSQELPVTLLGDRTDRIFDNLYYRDMSAQWGGINFHPGSTGSLISHATIKGMTTGITLRQESCDTRFLTEEAQPTAPADDPKRYAYGPDFMGDEHQQLIVRHSTIMNSDSSLISARNANLIVENSLLMNSAGALLELAGGAYDVTHCTLANYNYWAAFSRCDVVLRNFDYVYEGTDDTGSPTTDAEPLRQPCPLYRCNFTNTLVYGASGRDPNIDVNGFTRFVDEAGVPVDSVFAYRFDHCLLRSTTGYDDDDCIQIIWDEEPQYRLIDRPNYICDPHLLPESPCIGRGAPRTRDRLPLDLDGRPRQATPAIGCYEGTE